MSQDPASDRKDKIGSPNTPEGFVEGPGISPEEVKVGQALEAASFDGKWYVGKIVLVDDSDQTFLVHFDGWNVRFDEWYKFSSKKVRPPPRNLDLNRKKFPVFRQGENVLSRWVDDKFYRCHIVRAKSGDKYEVRFEDGVLTTVESNKIRKANKVDEYSESVRLLKQQETIERAKSRDLRLRRRTQQHQSECSTLLDTSSNSVFVSELTDLEEGLNLPISLPLSELRLRSLEVDEASPDLTVLKGRTFSVRSPSFVVGGACPTGVVPLHDTSPSPDPTPRDESEPPSPYSPSPIAISSNADIATRETSSLANLDAFEPPSVQAGPPVLSTSLPPYNTPLPYTETVMTADGRVLTLTPSYQQSPVPAPNPAPATAEPLYYQLVPIQVTPPTNPPNISIQPVDQSYLTIQQPYSYPIQTQFAPLVQQMPSPYNLADSVQPVNLTENLPQVASYVVPVPDAIHQVAPPSSSYSIPDALQHLPSIQLQTPNQEQSAATLTQTQLAPFVQSSDSYLPTYSAVRTVQQDSHSECNDDSDSESDLYERRLFIDVTSAPELNNPESLTSGEPSSARESKSSMSDEETDNRELKKLRLPDHNRRVAPRELVTTLESEPHLCERPGCSKKFRRKESLKKHLRLFHGEGSQESRKKTKKQKQPLSPPVPIDTDPTPTPPQFPTNADHSITQTELLFQEPTTPPPLVHRSKRKSSQPKKSSFHEPTTPTVTILVPSDFDPSGPDTQPIPVSPHTPAKPATDNNAPSRQSKRIRIRKNWDYDGEYVTNKKTDKSTKIKSTQIGVKSSKHDRAFAGKKALGASLKTKLPQELKEKAIVKIRPPKEQIIPTAEKNKTVETPAPVEDRESPLPEEPVSNEPPVSPPIEVESDQEVVQLVEEMEVVDSQVHIIDLMETSVALPTTEIEMVVDSEPTEEAPKKVIESVPEVISEIPKEKDNYESVTSESDEDIESSSPQELIECVCGLRKDEGVMVQCEQCMTWQHTSCMGLTDKDLPGQHICHECSDPPALIKREQYKHNNPWFQSGKLLYPTDADLVETGAQLCHLKNQLKSIQSLIPGLNLKINIAKNGNHPYLKEFNSKHYQMLTPEEIKDKVARLSESQSSEKEMDISFKQLDVVENEGRNVETMQPKTSVIEDEELTAQEISGNVDQPSEDSSENLRPEIISDQNPASVSNNKQFEETIDAPVPPDLDVGPLTEENIDPDLSALISALNGTDWGCQMRLFHNIEQIQNSLITQCSSIESQLTSLQFRIPDVEGRSLSDTLLQLQSFLEPISNK